MGECFGEGGVVVFGVGGWGFVGWGYYDYDFVFGVGFSVVGGEFG